MMNRQQLLARNKDRQIGQICYVTNDLKKTLQFIQRFLFAFIFFFNNFFCFWFFDRLITIFDCLRRVYFCFFDCLRLIRLPFITRLFAVKVLDRIFYYLKLFQLVGKHF